MTSSIGSASEITFEIQVIVFYSFRNCTGCKGKVNGTPIGTCGADIDTKLRLEVPGPKPSTAQRVIGGLEESRQFHNFTLTLSFDVHTGHPVSDPK
jgi:hypothetical protein